MLAESVGDVSFSVADWATYTWLGCQSSGCPTTSVWRCVSYAGVLCIESMRVDDAGSSE